jgi:DNA topoisomerase I
MKNLVIVESPTKARKLKGYLGTDYKVEASVGHVRDLPRKTLGVDVDKDFKPVYEVSEDKKEVVAKLQKLAKSAKNVYLAMDPDREGEAIAWHIKFLLNGKNKPKFLRSTFHEITKDAVLKAMEKPGTIAMDLVDAQQARRVLDRLVGYKVSPVLWKKIRRGLSAGRVQSVALRLIVEREREIEKFKPEEYWELDVALDSEKVGSFLPKQARRSKVEIFKDKKVLDILPEGVLVARVEKIGKKKYEPKSEKDVKGVVADLKKASYSILDIEKKERRRNALPPFITSTLQQAAANRLGYSAKQTMRLAQGLYEEGLITYHRTDSFNLAESAVSKARKYIQTKHGDQYLPEKPNFYARKTKNAQEAHEAIRITHINIEVDAVTSQDKSLTSRHAKLYDLIWRRFVASQMTPAVYDQTTVLIKATKGKDNYELKTNGSVQKFAGWTVLFSNREDVLLPDLEINQKLNYLDLNALQKFTQPPARYNDASLVKELESKGIGRPSTYASIISVIIDRGYVDREEKRFFATKIGCVVNDFLVKNFKDFMDYDFTAELEEDLDRIARGEKDWQKIVKSFYAPLKKEIAVAEKNTDRVKIPVEKTGKKCPECKKGNEVIKDGRFGKFLSCSDYPECKYTKNIVVKLDGQKCPLCSKGDIVVKNTRWGKPFHGCSRYPECEWGSWGKPKKDLKLTKKEWEEIKKKRAERRKKYEKNNKNKDNFKKNDGKK